MRWAGRRVAVYAHSAPTDMRKGFDSLCGVVTEQVGKHPLSGDVFLFVSRDRIGAKVLHFDGTGLCLYVKRLERGRFAALWRDEAAGQMTLTVSELDLFLDGSALVGRLPLTPPALTQFFACVGLGAMIYCVARWCRWRRNATSTSSGRSVTLLEREKQRLIAKNLELTAELARLRGLPDVTQLTFTVEQTLTQRRAAILDGPVSAPPPTTPPPPAARARAPRAAGPARRRRTA